MKKLLLTLLVLSMMVSVPVFSSGNSEESSQKVVEKTPLRVQFIGSFKEQDTTDPISGQKIEGVHYLKEEFEKLHPDVDVQFILMGWDSYTQKTIAMLQNNDADVYQVPGIASIAGMGLLEPLTPYIEKDNFDLSVYIDNQVKGWEAIGPDDDGLSTYGLPFIGDTRFISYDKKLFDDWGVEYLSDYPTLEEIETKAAAMTGINPKTGEQNYGLRMFGGSYLADTAMNISEGLGNTWGTGFSWDDMTVNFNTDEMVEAVTWMKENLKYCPPGNVSRQGDEKLYTPSNNIAINLRDDPNSLSKIEALGWGDRIGIAHLFVNPTYKMGNMFAGSPCAIGVSSEVKDAAWEWVKFSSSETFQRYFWEEYRSLPTIEKALSWDSINVIPQISDVLKTMEVLWVPRYPYRASEPRSIFAVQVEKALLGEQTPQEAMDQAQADTDAWILQQR
jgi:ABC-type glycerol-3-phosphate transport system substrate-binding protein